LPLDPDSDHRPGVSYAGAETESLWLTSSFVFAEGVLAELANGSSVISGKLVVALCQLRPSAR
jgi:hypothetical protein